MIYTVIGLHENGEVFAEHQEANDPHEAISAVADRKSYADAEILGAIATEAPFTAACEDSGKSAHVCDLGSNRVDIGDLEQRLLSEGHAADVVDDYVNGPDDPEAYFAKFASDEEIDKDFAGVRSRRL